jgi:hypothetical protein
MSWGHTLIVGMFGSRAEADGKRRLVVIRPFTRPAVVRCR